MITPARRQPGDGKPVDRCAAVLLGEWLPTAEHLRSAADPATP